MNYPAVAIMESLGLPADDCVRLDLTFLPAGEVLVAAAYRPKPAQGEAVAAVMRRYAVTLTPRSADPDQD
jgi:hypothetical protein